MPVYQYACTECGEQLEVRQSFTDAALTECPACEGRLRKVLNAVGVVFKGSGFYRNDSRAATNGGSGGSGASASGKDGTAKKGDSTSSPGSSKKESSVSASGGSDSKGSSDKSGGAKPTPAAAH